MAESLGTRLRQQRERQQIALASIAEQTKISISCWKRWNATTCRAGRRAFFRRAFVRAYAHAVGLEPDSVVREFLELHPDPVEADATAVAVPPAIGDEPVSQGPATRLRWLFDRAIGSLPRRRLQLNLTGQEEPDLDSALAGDRDSASAAAPADPELAVAVRLSTLTAIERATAVARDSVKAASPRSGSRRRPLSSDRKNHRPCNGRHPRLHEGDLTALRAGAADSPVDRNGYRTRDGGHP
jgi:hypothetical protein